MPLIDYDSLLYPLTRPSTTTTIMTPFQNVELHPALKLVPAPARTRPVIESALLVSLKDVNIGLKGRKLRVVGESVCRGLDSPLIVPGLQRTMQ